MEKVKTPVQITKASDELIENNKFFVIEGLSEFGIFKQWLNADLKPQYDENHEAYNLIWDSRTNGKNKIVWSIVGLEKISE